MIQGYLHIVIVHYIIVQSIFKHDVSDAYGEIMFRILDTCRAIRTDSGVKDEPAIREAVRIFFTVLGFYPGEMFFRLDLSL